MTEIKWLLIGCATLAGLLLFAKGAYMAFGDQTGAAILVLMLFIGAGAIVGDVLRGIFGRR